MRRVWEVADDTLHKRKTDVYKRQEVARYEKAAAYLAKHPDDKDSTQKELQEEQEKLVGEIAGLKEPLTEVQEDLKKLRAVSYTHLWRASALSCAGAVGRGCQHRAGAGAGKDCGRHPLP